MANVLLDTKHKTVDVSLLHRAYELIWQTQTKWCWAAVAAAIARFYDYNTPWTECKVASSELNLKCCGNDKKKCDQYWNLDKALKRVNHFNMMTGQSVTFNQIVLQLKANRLVAVRLQVKQKSGDYGHFAVIAGWHIDQYNTEWITLYDPMKGINVLEFSKLKKNYPTKGSSWNITYFTNP